ncbi:MAG: glycosyltransferase family 39 protein [Chloroflexota bacterium]
MSQLTSAGSAVLAGVRRHPDLVAVVVIIVVALAIRAAFVFRVPVYVTKDSLEYVEPALKLIAGGGLDLPQRRTPAYPVFMAASFALIGKDLLSVAIAQHLLGVGTAVAAFAIGRLAYGRLAGLVAGLLTALAAPLIIYEHYLITEALFAFLLVSAVAILVAAARARSTVGFAAGGVVLGLASLTRPVGQAVLVVVPFALLLILPRWKPVIKASIAAAACFALVVVPWAIRNQLVYGTATAASTGRFLISRSVKHERNFVFYEPRVGAYPGEDPQRTRARQIAQDVTNKRPEPGQVFQRIRDELRLTEAQTDAMLKDIALEAILRDPWLWVEGTVEMFFELIEGASKEEQPSWHLSVHDQPRVSNQWGDLAPLLSVITETQQNEARRADAVVSVFRPGRWFVWLCVLFLAGTAVAAVRSQSRLALLPIAITLMLLAASAALVGAVPRYRYPVDPLIYAVVGGGIWGCVSLAASAIRRLRPAPAANPPLATTPTATGSPAPANTSSPSHV